MKPFLIALSALMLTACQPATVEERFFDISITVPPEVFDWTKSAAQEFSGRLSDGSIIRPNITSEETIATIKSIPLGTMTSVGWISPHPALNDLVHDESRSLTPTFGKCRPLFDASIKVLGRSEEIARILPDSLPFSYVIRDPRGQSGFLTAMGLLLQFKKLPSGIKSLPKGPSVTSPEMHLSLLKKEETLLTPSFDTSTTKEFQSETSILPTLPYSYCIAEGTLLQPTRKAASVAFAEFLSTHQTTPPPGFVPTKPSAYREVDVKLVSSMVRAPERILTPVHEYFLLDASGSMAEAGFGSAQRILGTMLADIGDADRATVFISSARPQTFHAMARDKKSLLDSVTRISPQGEANIKQSLQNVIEKVVIETKQQTVRVSIITDGNELSDTTGLLSLLNKAALDHNIAVIFYLLADTPTIKIINDWRIPGVVAFRVDSSLPH